VYETSLRTFVPFVNPSMFLERVIYDVKLKRHRVKNYVYMLYHVFKIVHTSSQLCTLFFGFSDI